MGHFWGHQFVQPQTCSSFLFASRMSGDVHLDSKNKTTSEHTQRFDWRKMPTTQQKKRLSIKQQQGPSSLSLCNWEGSINRTNNEEPADSYALMQEKQQVLVLWERSNKNIFKGVVHFTVIKSSKSQDVYICYICLVTKPLPTGIVAIWYSAIFKGNFCYSRPKETLSARQGCDTTEMLGDYKNKSTGNEDGRGKWNSGKTWFFRTLFWVSC